MSLGRGSGMIEENFIVLIVFQGRWILDVAKSIYFCQGVSESFFLQI